MSTAERNNLTATQARALMALRRKGRLFARARGLQGTRGGTFNRETLGALVAAGLAKWDVAVLEGRAFDIVTEC